MANGSYFVDRNPHHFSYVLDYLRSGEVFPDDDANLAAVQEEANHFGLAGMERQVVEMMERRRRGRRRKDGGGSSVGLPPVTSAGHEVGASTPEV